MEAKQRDTVSQLEASQAQIRDLAEKVQMLLEAQKEKEDLERHRGRLEGIVKEEN
jgi:hypothetical protein